MNVSSGSFVRVASLTSARAEMRICAFDSAVCMSLEAMNAMSSHACCGYFVFGLSSQPEPPETLTKSCPLTPLPGVMAGILAQPTTSLRLAIEVVPQSFLDGQITERQK